MQKFSIKKKEQANMTNEALDRGYPAHKNPDFSLETVKGLVLFHRLSTMGEPFPDVLVPNDFLLRPMTHSETNHKKPIGYKTQNALNLNFHDHAVFVGNAGKRFF